MTNQNNDHQKSAGQQNQPNQGGQKDQQQKQHGEQQNKNPSDTAGSTESGRKDEGAK